MKYSNTKKSGQTKKLVKPFIFAITGLLLLGAMGYYLYTNRNDNLVSTDSGTTDTAEIDLNPPTNEEQQTGNDIKDSLPSNASTQPQPSQQGTATVIITDAAQYDDVIEVRSYISNHYEDGTCTITFTQGSGVVSKSTQAYRDAQTTICTNPLFLRADFPAAGTWQVKVSYKSTKAQGQSETQNVTIK